MNNNIINQNWEEIRKISIEIFETKFPCLYAVIKNNIPLPNINWLSIVTLKNRCVFLNNGFEYWHLIDIEKQLEILLPDFRPPNAHFQVVKEFFVWEINNIVKKD